MDVKMKTNKLSYLKTVCYKNVVREDSYEYVIPEPMPDVGEVTAVCGTVLLRSKDPQRGTCEVTAEAELSWIYTSPDEEGVRALETSVPIMYKAEGVDITEECFVSAVPEFVSCEARVISSRKVLFKVNSVCRIICRKEKETLIPEYPEENGYECSTEEYKTEIIKLSDEKTFEISSNFLVSEGRAAEILFWESRSSSVKASVSGRKLLFSGKLILTVVYKDGETEMPIYIEHEEEFSQTSECAYESISYINAQIAATSAYVTNEPGITGDGKSIGFDMGFVIQYVIGQEVSVKYLKDMYSTSSHITCEYDKNKIECIPKESEKSVTAVGNMKMIPDMQGFLGCSAALYPTPARDGNGTFLADGSASVVWRDTSGNIYNKYIRISSETINLEEDQKLISCSNEDGIISPMNGGAELRIPVCLRVNRNRNCDLRFVSSAEENESNQEAASLWITRASPESTLWEIGKRHGVSVRAIRNASGLDELGEPEAGTLLLIPKF